MALLDNGAQINTIMPSYVKSRSLEVGPIMDLIGRSVTCIGVRNAYTQHLGYVTVSVQVEGVQGYNKDQIALVVLDLSNFVVWVPVILGTPTISCVMNVMKEREIDILATPWANAWVAHLLSVERAAAMVEDDQVTGESSLGEYNKVVITKNVETIDAFSSHVIPVKTEKAYLGERINITMSQRQFSTSGDHCAECVCWAEDRQQKHHCSGEEWHSLPPNFQEENSCSMGCGCSCSARTTSLD